MKIPNSIFFEEDKYAEAKAKFEELKNSDEHDTLVLVDSHHEYSRGYWIEFKKSDLSSADFIIEEHKKIKKHRCSCHCHIEGMSIRHFVACCNDGWIEEI